MRLFHSFQHVVRKYICAVMVSVIAHLTVGCATEEPGIDPKRDAFYFPTSLARLTEHLSDPLSSQLVGNYFLVSNSNADLRFNGGTVMALDLAAIPRNMSDVRLAVESGTLSCAVEQAEQNSWICPEQQFILPESTLRVGDFPSFLRINENGRFFTPIRGENVLLWGEIAAVENGAIDLRCDDDPDTGCGSAAARDCEQWTCDERHLVNFSDRLERNLPAEPYGIAMNRLKAVHIQSDGTRRTCLDQRNPAVACDCADKPVCSDDESGRIDCCIPAPENAEHIYITHLDAGEVSFARSDSSGVVLADIRSELFGDSVGGATFIAQSLPGDPEAPVYISSRLSRTLSSFVIRDFQRIIPANRFDLNALSPADDVRGIRYSSVDSILYAVTRDPPALSAIDMQVTQGEPAERTLWSVEVCAEPSGIYLSDQVNDEMSSYQSLAYVVCFAEGRIFVVNIENQHIEGTIVTGRGPNDVVLDTGSGQPCASPEECTREGEHCVVDRCLTDLPRAYVTNFLDNTIGIIDLRPDSPHFRAMILQIGDPEDLVAQQ